MNKTERQSGNAATHMINTSDRCSIAVVYTDRQSRERAIGLCDSLAGHLPKELQLEFTWWNTNYLRDSEVAELAGDAVANSDLVLFSSTDDATLTPEVKSCFERAIGQADDRERALAVYIERAGKPRPSSASSLDWYLKDVARRGGMDYLAMDDRPQRPVQTASSHWGINE